MADNINLPNLVSHLAVNLDGVSGAVADASRQGSAMGSALGNGVHRQLDDLLRNLPQVQIDGDSEPLDRDLARIHRQLSELDGQRIGVDISVPDALRQLEELETHLQRIGDEHHDVNVRAATAAAAAQLEELRLAARQLDDTDVDIDVDVDEDRPNRLVGILGRVAAAGASAGASIAAGMGTASLALGAVAPLVAGIVTTLANIAPAAGVAVTGLLAVQLASGALKLAMVGVEDAVSAALDPSKSAEFEEALKKLSPEAQQFALAVRDAAPALRELQQDVQDRVFDGFAEKLRETSGVVLPDLRKGLLDTGDTLNLMGDGVLDAAKDLGEDGTLGRAIDSASGGLRNLSGVPGIVVTALGQVADAAGPSFERLTEGAADAAENIGDKLGDAFESGRMEDAIETALDLLGQLFDVGGNVVQIVTDIFGAVPEGGGMLGVLEDITDAIAEFTSSKDAQDAFGAIFETIGRLGETAAPLLLDLLESLAPAIADLGPPAQELVDALGEGLAPIIEELASSGALETLAEQAGSLVGAITPLLPPLGELVAAILPYLVELLEATSFTIEALSGIIDTVVIPVLQILTDLLRGDFSSAWDTAKNAAVNAFEKLQDIAETQSQFISDRIDDVVGFLSALPGRAGAALGGLAGAILDRASEAGRQLLDALQRKGSEALTYLQGLPGRAGSALGGLAGALAGRARDAGAQLAGAIRTKIEEAVSYVRSLPSRAAGAIGNLGGILAGAGRSLISGFISGIRDMIPSVQSVLSGLTNQLPDWKGPKAKDAKILTPAGRSLIEGFIKGIDGTTAKLRSRLESITKALPANVKSGYGKSLKASTKELEKLVSQRDRVVKKLAEAEKKLAALRKEGAKAATDITEGILKDANIVQGNSLVNSVAAITVGLQQAVKKTKEFEANIEKLKKSGLRADLLQQIADEGVAGGAATAAALAKATPAELKKINDLQAQLAKSATSTGNTVGDALYNAGIRAAEGLVKGLQSQEAKIEKAMTKIAKSMLDTVKKVHRTKSPSRAFWDIGEMDGEGLRGGLLATTGRVRAAARTMAGAALDVASGVGGALAVTPSGPQLASAYAGGGGGDTTNNFHLYGSEASPDGILRALSWQGLVGRR